MKIIRYLLIVIFLILFSIFCFLFIGSPKKLENIEWGINFSHKHAKSLGLNWKEAYLALIEDLGVRKIKIGTHWDLLEPNRGEYDFEDLDWQIEIAEEKSLELILVIGMKTPRWPECHIPAWADGLPKEEQQERILIFLEETVKRYKDKKSILSWQVENEPFFPFGECPWTDIDFLKKEISLVKELSEKPVMITETGEFSLWFKAARLADIVGVTMYRKVWFSELNRHVSYFFPATFYRRKALLVKWILEKEVIGSELQAEPWGSTLLYYSPLEEQEKSMDVEQFKKNIDFAKKAGLKKNYFWGAEWWYWMKIEHNQPEIWEEAEKLFKN